MPSRAAALTAAIVLNACASPTHHSSGAAAGSATNLEQAFTMRFEQEDRKR
jgi:hypothetical protein